MLRLLVVSLLFVSATIGLEFFNPYPGGTPGLPGVKIFLTNKGTNYFNMAASKSLNAKIRNFARLRSLDRTVKLAVMGNATATLHDIELMSFKNLTSHYHKLPAANRFRWEVSGGYVLLRGNWRMSYKPVWSRDPIRMNGHFFAESVQGPELTVSAQIEKKQDKTFKITNVQCNANLPDLSLCVYGGGSMGIIVSFLNRFITDAVRADLEKEMCRLTAAFVENVLNIKAQENPHKYYVTGTKLDVDYGLLKDPQMTETGLEVWIKGDTVHRDFPDNHVPFYPHPMPQPDNFDKMLYVQLSDFNLNSVTYQLHQYHLDSFDSSKEEMPGELQMFLRLKCRRSELCLGSVRMDIAEKFPSDAKGELHVHTISPAQILFTENGALAKASAYFELVAVTSTQTSRIFGANGTAVGDLDFAIVDVSDHKSAHLIHKPKLIAGMKLRTDQLTVDGAESEFMDDDQVVDFVQFVLPYAVEAIESLVNSTFNIGFVHVQLMGMKTYLKNPQVQVRDRTLQLSTDFVFKHFHDELMS